MDTEKVQESFETVIGSLYRLREEQRVPKPADLDRGLPTCYAGSYGIKQALLVGFWKHNSRPVSMGFCCCFMCPEPNKGTLHTHVHARAHTQVLGVHLSLGGSA